MSQQKSRVSRPSSLLGDWSHPFSQPLTVSRQSRVPVVRHLCLIEVERTHPNSSAVNNNLRVDRSQPWYPFLWYSSSARQTQPSGSECSSRSSLCDGKQQQLTRRPNSLRRSTSLARRSWPLTVSQQKSRVCRPSSSLGDWSYPLFWLLTVSQSKSRVCRPSSSLGDWSHPLSWLLTVSQQKSRVSAASNAKPSVGVLQARDPFPTVVVYDRASITEHWIVPL